MIERFSFILFVLFTLNLQTQQQIQAPALLLTTYDSISIVYPKEMGYEKDFLQIIYKITEQNDSLVLRIEDAVYDQNQASIYFILSIHRISAKTSGVENLGCELIRLKQHQHLHHNHQRGTTSGRSNHIIASNWSQNLIYKNQTISILSMQMNDKKMKIYWLEYNYLSNKWSIVVMKLNQNSHSFDYYTFTRPNVRFSTDGYSYISVIYDTIDEQPQTKPNLKKLSKKAPRHEILLFITNNQTLNICFLSNLTCRNFFGTNHNQVSDYENEDEYYGDEEQNLLLEKQVVESTTVPLPLNQPTVTFSRLMGIQYDQKEHTLYIADYGYDRIEKVVFEMNSEEFTDNVDIKASYIQTLVQSSPGQLPINPIMSIAYDNNIFWTDFEDGLKSTIYKSPCIRSVYRVKNSTTLKLIHIIAKATSINNKTLLQNNIQGQNGYRLSSIQKNQFLFPPDYYLFSTDNNEFEALMSSANSMSNFSIIHFLFFSILSSTFA